MQNDILLDLDKKRGVILVLLDLSAAYDTIDHELLLHLLSQRLGISGRVHSWIASYLSGRTQSVSIDGNSSKSLPLLFGVPQGSVLGPFLYTIYTLPLGNIQRDLAYLIIFMLMILNFTFPLMCVISRILDKHYIEWNAVCRE